MMSAMIVPSYAFDSAMCQMDTTRHRKTLCSLYKRLEQLIALDASRRADHGYSGTHTWRRKEAACG